MKQIKSLLFAAALFIGATSFTNAQSKVAHINVGELVTSMPEMKTAQDASMKKPYEVKPPLLGDLPLHSKAI